MTKRQDIFQRRLSFLKRRLPDIVASTVLIAVLSISAVSQQPTVPPAPSQAASPAPATPEPDPFYAPTPHPNETKFLQHLAEDQKDIFASPFHVNDGAFKWLAPSAAIAGGLFASDPDSSFAMKNSHDHALNLFSDAGLAAAAGLSGASYFWGHITHNERMRETGVLATEAMRDVCLRVGRGAGVPEPVHRVWRLRTGDGSQHGASGIRPALSLRPLHWRADWLSGRPPHLQPAA